MLYCEFVKNNVHFCQKKLNVLLDSSMSVNNRDLWMFTNVLKLVDIINVYMCFVNYYGYGSGRLGA